MIDDGPHSAKRHRERWTIVGGRFRDADTKEVGAQGSAHLIDRTGLKWLQLDPVDAASQLSHDVGPIPHAL